MVKQIPAPNEALRQGVAVPVKLSLVLPGNVSVILPEHGVIQKMRPVLEVFLVVSSADRFQGIIRNTANLVRHLDNLTELVSSPSPFPETRADKGSDLLMVPARIRDVIFVAKLVNTLEMLFVLVKHLVAEQPVLKQAM